VYDAGDLVEVKGKKLLVSNIGLSYLNFEEITDPDKRGTVVQISYGSLGIEVITNWTRSAVGFALGRTNAAEP
jgi:hypothetical protein